MLKLRKIQLSSIVPFFSGQKQFKKVYLSQEIMMDGFSFFYGLLKQLAAG